MTEHTQNMQSLWQSQALDAPRISLAFVRHQIQALQRRARIHNALENIGGAVALVWMVTAGWRFIIPRSLFSLATALWALAVLYMMLQRYRRFRVPVSGEQMGTLDALQFYRQQLARQRDARRGNWRWWLPPLVPSIIVTFIALFVEVHPTPWAKIAFVAGWIVCGVSLAIVRNEQTARAYQREIDALDTMGKSGS
jgi:hypothetical protein